MQADHRETTLRGCYRAAQALLQAKRPEELAEEGARLAFLLGKQAVGRDRGAAWPPDECRRRRIDRGEVPFVAPQGFAAEHTDGGLGRNFRTRRIEVEQSGRGHVEKAAQHVERHVESVRGRVRRDRARPETASRVPASKPAPVAGARPQPSPMTSQRPRYPEKQLPLDVSRAHGSRNGGRLSKPLGLSVWVGFPDDGTALLPAGTLTSMENHA